MASRHTNDPVKLKGGTVVYVVVGETGEYSDFHTWDVVSYADRSQAEFHLAALQEVTKGCEDWDYDRQSEFKTTLDPFVDMDYNGVTYSIEVIKMFDHFDQFQEEQEE